MKRYINIKNIGRLVTMTDLGEGPLGVIEDACIMLRQGKIDCLGKACDLPQYEDYLVETIDAGGGVVIPGLVDCHTHLVHAGSRENESAMRSEGKSYEDIARAGGGILSTVKATREAPFEKLCELAAKRADEALSRGVTTLEVKSGYGLDTETEIKILKVVEWLHENHPISFEPTFLGAHVIPGEFKDRREKYIDIVINEMIPKVAEEELALFCDVFVENIAFTIDEAEKIIAAAKHNGLKIKLHADQLSCGKGAELAARVGAVSADHLEHISDAGISALKEAGTAAVMLPGSTFYLGQKNYAPARKLIDAGVTVALSTDYNPGTTPSLDLWLTATIAASLNKMTYDECLKGVTVNAAKALDIDDGRGYLRKDGAADLLILDSKNEYYPIYRYGSSSIKYVIKNGKIRYSKDLLV